MSKLAPNFTQIPNFLLDSGVINKHTTFRIMMAICRKTYGYHKKKDRISISQLEKMTGISKRAIIRSLKELEDLSLILTAKKDGTVTRIEVNDSYQPVHNSHQLKSKPVTESNQQPVTESNRQNKDINKDNGEEQSSVSEDSFSLVKEIEKTCNDSKQHVRIIGHYLKTKYDDGDLTDIVTKEQFGELLKRNMKIAVRMKPFAIDRQVIANAFEKARQKSEYGRKFNWTLETVYKFLTV
jgi:phage replication O-like protein O